MRRKRKGDNNWSKKYERGSHYGKENLIIYPYYLDVFCILWIFILCADFYYSPDFVLVMVLHGLCAVLGIVSAVLHWIRYKKEKFTEIDVD